MPNATVRIASFILVAALCGCGSTLSSTFTPHAGAQADLPQVAAKATLVKLLDVGVLERTGSQILGNVEVEGGGSADDYANEAAIVAAHHGGTHIFGPIRSPGPQRSSRRAYSFVILKVPSERWDELPSALRPAQFEQGASK